MCNAIEGNHLNVSLTDSGSERVKTSKDIRTLHNSASSTCNYAHHDLEQKGTGNLRYNDVKPAPI